jgi:hypothetical protein
LPAAFHTYPVSDRTISKVDKNLPPSQTNI